MKKQIMRMIAGVLCAVMLLGDGSLAYATSGAADLQHRTEKDFMSTMLPTSYYDAVDVTAKGDSLGFAYHAMSDASTGNTGVVVTYCANKVGNYEATVKLRDGNKAKGKFSFKIK